MASRTTLKTYFNTGDTPTEANFVDLIDSLAHVSEDSLLTTSAASAAYQPLDSDLTAIAALATTSFGRSLLALADGTTLGQFALISDSTTARTLALTDARKYIRCSNASAITVTVPPQVSVAWVADTEILIEQAGAGQVTIAAGSGVTLRTSTTAKSSARYSAVSLKRVASNEWVIGGDRSAS